MQIRDKYLLKNNVDKISLQEISSRSTELLLQNIFTKTPASYYHSQEKIHEIHRLYPIITPSNSIEFIDAYKYE